jgi:eukaryotic-like serine/threonine-protein kinase
MGLVVAAQHVTLRQRVAVKFLLPEAMELAGASERFLREARAAVAIQSEHVARVLDVETLESGSPYMVMEYLTGVHLGQLLRTRGPLPVVEAVDYVLQICEAMAEAHARGIIHRDLKPANLFLTKRADGSPLVKVLDFGLSKPIRPDAPNALDVSLTSDNAVLGSPQYMSPEQIRCVKSIDARTDLWSIGVILYELLTGRRPFEADSIAVMFEILAPDPPASILSGRPDLPAPLAEVVMRCLEKDVSQRVQNIAELAQALAPFGSPGSSVSVERISRVLANHVSPSAATRPPPSAARSSAAPPLPPPPARPSAPAGGLDSTTAMASTLTDDTQRSSLRLTRPTLSARGRRVALAVSTAISVVLLGSIAALGLRGPRPHVTAVAFSAPSSPDAPATSAPTLASPPPTALATATAAPVGTVGSPVPSATASSAVLRPAGPKPSPSVGAGAMKRKKGVTDPMDRWN